MLTNPAVVCLLWISALKTGVKIHVLMSLCYENVSYTSTHINELLVTLATLISHTSQMRVSLLAVFAHHTAVIEWILTEKALRVVVTVNVDFSQSIMSCGFLTAFVDAGF